MRSGMDNNEEFEFALHFMSDHPESAVKVLEQSDTEAVAGLLSNAPVNYVTPVIKFMLPEYAARICEMLAHDRAAAILSTLDANAASVILRLMPGSVRQVIQTEMPTTLRTQTELLLEYPDNTVGAWMSPHMLVAASDMKNKNLLRLARQSSSQDDSEYIWVTDRDGTYLGRTRFIDMLKESDNLPVTGKMDSDCPSLPASMLLEQAQVHRAWEYSDVLPVTNAENRLLGLLHHHFLRQALSKRQAVNKTRAMGEDALSGIFEVYGQSLLALLNTVSESVDKE